MGLEQAIVEPPIIHVKCFAHMANLVLQSTLESKNVSKVMEEVTLMQNFIADGGCKRATREKVPELYHLTFKSRARTCRRADVPICISAEIYELYVILFPFARFVRVSESRNFALTSIGPLA
jgi:hypothetical protein